MINRRGLGRRSYFLHLVMPAIAMWASASEPYWPIMLNFSVSVGGVRTIEQVFVDLSNTM